MAGVEALTKHHTNIMDFLASRPEAPVTSPVALHGAAAPGMSREEEERYLLSLLSFGLDRVAAEPERLAGEARAGKKETEAHAVENYGAFLESAVCVRNVREELESSGRLLHELAARVPLLETAICDMSERAAAIERERKDVSTTFKQHSQLLEILEVPQLLDTAVRNEYYEEALDLAAFARRLQGRLPDIPLLQDLVVSVEACEQQLLHQLLSRLQSNIQLPACLHVIGLLRRLGRHTDLELRQQFLQCRDSWLQASIDDSRGAAASSSGSYAHLCKFTDLIRMHMFEIVTQYRAIFLDFNSLQEDKASEDGGLLYAWAHARLSHYLSVLCKGLPNLKEGNQIASVLDKAMYCGAYLGREGLDFRGSLSPPFEARVLALLQAGLSSAQASFESALQSHMMTPMPPALKSRYEESSGASAPGLHPPSSLLDHPPLAVLCNKVSEVLNELRECAIASTRSRAHNAVASCLSLSCESLAMFWVEQESSLDKAERNQVLSAMRCMVDALLPYISNCLQKVYGTAKPELKVSVVAACVQEQVAFEEKAQRERELEAERRKKEEEEQKRRAEEAAAAARRKAEEEVAEARRRVEAEAAERKRKEEEAVEAKQRAVAEAAEAKRKLEHDAEAKRKEEQAAAAPPDQ